MTSMCAMLQKTFEAGAAASELTSDVISMRQIPEKIFICLRPQYKAIKPNLSNNLCFPITKLNLTFNNVSGL